MVFGDIQNFKSVHNLYLSVEQTTENVDVSGSAPSYSVWVSISCNLYQFFLQTFLWQAGKIKLMQIQTIDSNSVPNHRQLLRIPIDFNAHALTIYMYS